VPVNSPNIDCTTCPAAGTVDIKPRRTGQESGPDRRRPQRAPASRERGVPELDDRHRFVMGCPLGRPGAHVEREAIGASRVVFGHGGRQCSASRGPSGGVIVSSCCAARAPGMVDVTLLQRFIEHMGKSDTCSAQLQRDIGFGLIHIGGVNMLCPAR
jgi:hypothetical protein